MVCVLKHRRSTPLFLLSGPEGTTVVVNTVVPQKQHPLLPRTHTNENNYPSAPPATLHTHTTRNKPTSRLKRSSVHASRCLMCCSTWPQLADQSRPLLPSGLWALNGLDAELSTTANSLIAPAATPPLLLVSPLLPVGLNVAPPEAAAALVVVGVGQPRLLVV